MLIFSFDKNASLFLYTKGALWFYRIAIVKLKSEYLQLQFACANSRSGFVPNFLIADLIVPETILLLSDEIIQTRNLFYSYLYIKNHALLIKSGIGIRLAV